MAKRVVNLDEAHIASDEDESPEVVLGGQTYTLPSELPLTVVVAIQTQDIRAAVEGLFGDAADMAMKAGLSAQDLTRIAEGAYGLAAGE